MEQGSSGPAFNSFLQALFAALMDRNAPLYEDTTSVGGGMGAGTGINGGSIGSQINPENNPWGGSEPMNGMSPDYDPGNQSGMWGADTGTDGSMAGSGIGNYTGSPGPGYGAPTQGGPGLGVGMDTIRQMLMGMQAKQANPRPYGAPGLGVGMGGIQRGMQGMPPRGPISHPGNPRQQGLGVGMPQVQQGAGQLGLLGQLARQVIGNAGQGAQGASRQLGRPF